MKQTLLIGILFLSIMITGCHDQKVDNVSVLSTSEPIVKQSIELYLEEDLENGPYEPNKGIYLGAYVGRDKGFENKITSLEEDVEKEHVFRVYQYTDSSSITEKDLLKCLADKKVPYIKILLRDTKDLTPIYGLIGSIKSRFEMPVFIELYPVTEKIDDPKVYHEAYKDAYELIKDYLEKATIVWSVDLNQVENMMLYYPGEDYVDWAGLNIFLPRYKNGIRYAPNIEEKLDYWYKTFQGQKPLMLSSLAISCFSRLDHTYSIESAKNQLQFFYEKVPVEYPRIKGIISVHVDLADLYEEGQDDYELTHQESLRKYIKKLYQNSIFLSHLEQQAQHQKVYIKQTVDAATYKGKTYMNLDYAESIFEEIKFEEGNIILDDQGTQYYDLSPLLKHYSAFYTK